MNVWKMSDVFGKLWKIPKHRLWILVIVGILVVFLVSSWILFREDTSLFTPSNAEVVIIDQLEGSYPNQTFKKTITELMNDFNMDVDYFKHDEISVDLFRNLLRNDYRLIILRMHAATGEEMGQPSLLALFTGEPYSKSRHIWEQVTDQVIRVRVDIDSDSYFGIYPSFVSQGMKGTCRNATVIMMGCHGLTSTIMAEAFIEKGANIYVGWDGPIIVEYVDCATTQFLRYVFVENLSIEESVNQVMNHIGPDPIFGSVLSAYYKE